MEDKLNNCVCAAECRKDMRYKSCQVLHDRRVPYVIWFEDALSHFGVPTVVFDLYLLVEDIDRAAKLLIEAGWVVDMENPHKIGNSEVQFPQQRLMSPSRQTKTVILPAADWKFPLPNSPLEQSMLAARPPCKLSFPTLSRLLDALIESWLDCATDDAMLLIHLACQISYLYAYAPSLKEQSFCKQMKYEHHQFHFDVLSGMESGTLPFRRHQRAIRDALLKGQYQLQECSAPRDDKLLFYIKKDAPS